MTTNGTHIEIHRGWFVFLGTALIVLGLVAVAVPLAATMAVELLVGWLFVFGGVAHVVHAVGARGAHGIWPPLFLGLLYLVGGVFFLLYPLGGMLTLTLVLAVFLALEGAGQDRPGPSTPATDRLGLDLPGRVAVRPVGDHYLGRVAGLGGLGDRAPRGHQPVLFRGGPAHVPRRVAVVFWRQRPGCLRPGGSRLSSSSWEIELVSQIQNRTVRGAAQRRQRRIAKA